MRLADSSLFDLEAVMTDAMSTTETDELWSVQLPNGQIQKGTLDQLDEAFQAGAITSDSLVCAPGETTWAKLGELAGLEAPAAPAASVIAAPVAMPSAAVSFAPPAPVSYAPPAMVGANSLRPVMMDMDDLDVPAPRSKKGILVGAAIAVAACGAIAALGFTIIGGASADEAAAAALAAQQKPSAPVVAPPPPAAPAPAADDTSKAKPLLSDAQKKALLDADEARNRLLKTKASDLAAARGPKTHKTGIKDSTGFAAPRKSGACTCKHGDPLCSCM